MKKLIIYFILTAGLFSYSFSQEYGWIDISANLPVEADLSDVFFVSDNEGWITNSFHSEIYHTTDGGETFEVQITPLGATIAVHMLDSENGYSGGDGGWVYKTDDGGLNWNMLASMGTVLDISFPPNTLLGNPVGYASGDNGNVWEISSILTNLNGPSSSSLSGICASSDNNVWVCGGNRIYYYNGTDFTSQIAPSGTFNDIHFINNQEGWVVGDGGVIGHTNDGGENWIEQTNPDIQFRALMRVFPLDSDNIWAVGNGGIFLHTIDGGVNWIIEEEELTSAFLRGVHFNSATNGYAVGNDKTLLKYTEVSGIGDNSESIAFDIFPNPAQDKMHIRHSDLGTESGVIEILSLDGKKILEKEFETGFENLELDLNNLESGIYLCRITIDNRSSTKKIIKE